MKMVITVTAVYDFPEDVEVEDLVEGEDSLGQHIVVKGRKLQPIIDFLEYDGLDGDSHSWDESDEEELEEIYDCLDSEEYTIIQVDGPADVDS
jgi:hypothetical protein